jgi:hypothetical protein
MHTAFEQSPCAEAATDESYVFGRIVVGEGRGSRHHLEVADSGQIRDDSVGQTETEKLRLGIGAHRLEREDGDGPCGRFRTHSHVGSGPSAPGDHDGGEEEHRNDQEDPVHQGRSQRVSGVGPGGELQDGPGSREVHTYDMGEPSLHRPCDEPWHVRLLWANERAGRVY